MSGLDLDLARFDFRQVEQIVDKLSKFSCRSLNVDNLLFLFGGQVPVGTMNQQLA